MPEFEEALRGSFADFLRKLPRITIKVCAQNTHARTHILHVGTHARTHMHMHAHQTTCLPRYARQRLRGQAQAALFIEAGVVVLKTCCRSGRQPPRLKEHGCSHGRGAPIMPPARNSRCAGAWGRGGVGHMHARTRAPCCFGASLGALESTRSSPTCRRRCLPPVQEENGKEYFQIQAEPPRDQWVAKRMTLVVQNRADLWRVCLKSPHARVEIPELEFEINVDGKKHIDSIYNHIAQVRCAGRRRACACVPCMPPGS